MASLTIFDRAEGDMDIRETLDVANVDDAGIILTTLWVTYNDENPLFTRTLLDFARKATESGSSESFTVSNECPCPCGSKVEFTYTV